MHKITTVLFMLIIAASSCKKDVTPAPYACLDAAETYTGVYQFSNCSQFADDFTWNFGDGSPESSKANPLHSYTVAGTYTATVTATSAYTGKSTSASKTIVVNQPGPSASDFAGTWETTTCVNNDACEITITAIDAYNVNIYNLEDVGATTHASIEGNGLFIPKQYLVNNAYLYEIEGTLTLSNTKNSMDLNSTTYYFSNPNDCNKTINRK